jgi:hypothetical protein
VGLPILSSLAFHSHPEKSRVGAAGASLPGRAIYPARRRAALSWDKKSHQGQLKGNTQGCSNETAEVAPDIPQPAFIVARRVALIEGIKKYTSALT